MRVVVADAYGSGGAWAATGQWLSTVSFVSA